MKNICKNLYKKNAPHLVNFSREKQPRKKKLCYLILLLDIFFHEAFCFLWTSDTQLTTANLSVPVVTHWIRI